MQVINKLKSRIDKLILKITNPIFIIMLEYAVSIIMIIGYYGVAVPLMFTLGGIYPIIGIAMYVIPLLIVGIGWWLYDLSNMRKIKNENQSI